MSFQRDGSLAVRRTQAMSTDGWQFSGDAARFCRADSGRGAWRTQGLVRRIQVGNSTPELTDGAAFDERRVLGPWFSRIFCDKIA